MEWADVHIAAALVVAEGLVELGVLRGSPGTLVESGAAKLFFAHSRGASRRPRRPGHRRGVAEGVDWDRVDALHGFGGVRWEQNVLITDDGCEVLTASIPW